MVHRGVATLVAVAAPAMGARIARTKKAAQKGKTLAGVPVLNYDLAYDGATPALAALEATEEKWVVVFGPSATDARLQELCSAAGQACQGVGHPSAGGVPFVEVQATEKALESLLGVMPGEVEFVEPDLPVHLIPELKGTKAEAASASWGLDRVGVPQRGGLKGRGAHIYVLDTGVRQSHADFTGRAAPAFDVTSGRGKECSGWGARWCAQDKHGHGTHCAGTAAGDKYGVATEAAIHGVKVLGDDGGGEWSWSYVALDWLATKGQRPAIASMSLGGDGIMNAAKTAIDSATGAGIVVIVAGGNNDQDACSYSPAYVPSAITVGSTTNEDKKSGFSNYGGCVEIWAPGSDIFSAGHTSDSDEALMSGTSMATPHVAGGAAQLLGEQPSLTPKQVLQGLLARAETDALAQLEKGDVNKLLWVGEGPAPAPAPTPPPSAPRCNREQGSARWPQPDKWGDCFCRDPELCVKGNATNWFQCPTSDGVGRRQGKFFQYDCEDCWCIKMR